MVGVLVQVVAEIMFLFLFVDFRQINFINVITNKKEWYSVVEDPGGKVQREERGGGRSFFFLNLVSSLCYINHVTEQLLDGQSILSKFS